MKAAEVRALSDDELAQKLSETKKAQFNLRFRKASGQLEQTSEIKKARRDVARIKTIQRQRGRAEG